MSGKTERRWEPRRGRFDAFLDEHHRALRRDAWTYIPMLLGVTVVLAVSDGVVFEALPGAADRVRLARFQLLGLGVVGMGLLWLRPGWVRGLGVMGCLGVTSIMASGLADIGGLGTAWPHFVYPFLLSPLLFFHTKAERFAHVAAQGAVVFTAFFVLHPDNLRDPLAVATVIFVVFMSLISVVYGRRQDVYRLTLFSINQDLERQRQLLSARVREQVRDLTLLVQHLDNAREAERAHVARELHDELGQLLTACRLALRLMQNRYLKSPEGIGPNLDHLSHLFHQMTDETRALLEGLRTPIVEDLGLLPAIRTLCEHWEEVSGCPHTLSLPQFGPPLDDAQATATYRCVQEALTNVARHAAATHVEVRLWVEGGALHLRVADNGRGIPADIPHGLGLIGMRERVASLGGSLAISGSRASGTTLRISVPLKMEVEA